MESNHEIKHSQPQACCLDYDGNSLSIVSYGTVGTEDGIYEWLGWN